jgi:hypothetical protein
MRFHQPARRAVRLFDHPRTLPRGHSIFADPRPCVAFGDSSVTPGGYGGDARGIGDISSHQSAQHGSPSPVVTTHPGMWQKQSQL